MPAGPRATVRRMNASSLEKAAAKLFCAGFHGHSIPAEFAQLQARGITGAILFRRNVESPAQVAELNAELGERAGRPFLVSVDQEGGRVMRLRDPCTDLPPMRDLGAADDPALARRLGAVLGRELRALGFDLDFAPVLDVDTNPANPVIGDRSFGRSAAQVAALGSEAILGLQEAGVAACGKHFPGHGDTSQDSHEELPRLSHDPSRLEAVELPPFQAAIRAGVASIMSAHVIFEALDPVYPATMSRPALDGILRDRWGYDGVVISDDLEMKAIADHFGIEEAVVRGVNAGVDLFLVCHTPALQNEAIDRLIAAVERGDVSLARVEEAGRRIDALVSRFVRPKSRRPDLSVLGCDEHREVVASIARAAGRAAAAPGRDPTERA